MKLEEILGGIAKSPSETKANKTYSPDSIVQTSEYLKNLSEVDAGTTEGLEEYRSLTGLPTKGISDRKVDLRKRQILEHTVEVFTNYTDSHIGSITGEIPEIIQANIGYEFCPTTKGKPGKYEKTRIEVSNAKEKIKEINEKPEDYLKRQVDKAPEYLKGIVARLPQEVLKIDSEDARENAFREISKYGTGNFVKDTYTHQKSLEEEVRKDLELIQKERNELARNASPGMDSEEKAKYFAENNKKMMEIRKKAQEIGSIQELRETIVGTAIESIKQKQAQESS